MSHLIPYTPPTLAPREARQLGRGLAQVEGQLALRSARIAAEAELQSARIDAVSMVTSRALQSVAALSQLEQGLAQAAPLATARLQTITDMATLALLEVVTDTPRRIRSA
jgi:hypothetical protein